jgi:hypothetical protein
MTPPIIENRVSTREEEAIRQALAEETLKEACTSNSFVCGVFLYDIGHPFKEVYMTQSTLTCADPIEPHLYTLGARLRCGLTEKLCRFCAEGSAEDLEKELCILFTTVLAVC